MKPEFERADPAALAAFDPRTKACTMNCGPSFDDPRSPEERRLLCPDCETVKVPRQQDFDWADKQLPAGITRQDVCIWTQDSDGPWNTSCGVTWEYNDGGPAENKAHFCHHCGGVLLADPFADDDAQPNKGNDWPPLKDAPVPECATINAPSDGTKVLHGQVESPRVSNLPSYGGSNNAAGQGPSLTVKDDSKSPQGGRTTPATAAPTPAALSAGQIMDRLASHYDFQCEGGPLCNCVEWQRLRQVLASLQPPAQGNAELVRAIERLRKEWQRAADCSDFPDLDNQDFLDVIEAATALSRQPSQQGPSEEEIAIAKDGLGKHTIISDMATLRSAILRWAEQTGRAG